MMRTLLFILLCAQVFGYSPPIGIPNPALYFGWEIDRATPGWPASWTAGSPSETANYYYIDKTEVGATNSGRTYGRPGAARLTPPEGTLAAGAFLYIHAGTYTSSDSGGDRFNWNGAGTSGSPIWITGNPAAFPTFTDFVHIGEGGSTSYLVFENFNINSSTAARINIRPTTDGQNIDHILVRNSVLTGTGSSSDSSAILVSLSQSSDTLPNSTVTDIVIYDNTISGYGDKATSDECGVENGYHTNRVWVLNNTIHDVGADSVAGSHFSNYTTKLTENYYIGGNLCYGNGENGIDVKAARYVIVSQNTVYGPFAREQGGGMVFHYGADTAFHDRDVWVIFNTIYHVAGGIATGLSSGADNLNVAGNVIYDVRASYAVVPDVLNGYCVFIGGSDGTFRITDNTFFDYDGGLLIRGIGVGDAVKISGNIFAGKTGTAGFYELNTTNGEESRFTLDYNLYPASSAFLWAAASRTFSYMQATAGQEANSPGEQSPGFVNAPTDFRITSSSPAYNASVVGPVGDTVTAAFQALYPGAGVNFDFQGFVRPAANREIGAFEVGSSRTRVNGKLTVGTAVLP